MKFIRSLTIKLVCIASLFSNSLSAAPDKLFIDLVNYSASIDGYSSLCVQNYDDDQELNSLFALLRELKDKYLLFTDDDYDMLKSTYMKTKSATITQLMKLKLNVQKSNCSNYLKIFERFDRKKQKSLEDLERMINAYWQHQRISTCFFYS